MSDDNPKFDFEAVFDPDDYIYFYEDMATEELTEKQVAFLVRELQLDKSVRILDLACGYGRHANRLAQRGYLVVGMDYSEAFLDIARKEAEAKGLDIKYLRGDMREMNFDNEFDRVIMMFTAVGYFNDQENYKVFQNVSRALKPGGLLCFDTINRDLMLKNFRPHVVTDKNGDMMIDRNSFDSVTGRITNRRTIIRNGQKREFEFSIRLYNPTEIELLLNQAGLKIVRFYGDWEGIPMANDWRMIVTARK